MTEPSKQYDPATIEPAVSARWLEQKAFAATPDDRADRYVVMMPLPNVTGALHMGHAMDNVMQDMLTRWHRMRGDNSLWQAGTDHAGIATQQVVETRLFELEGKTRHDVGREELVRRIWEWKDQYQKRIVGQQQRMGCSCDWDRQRFTMDAVCARAVRHTFFRMFAEGLIYQGDRLVNWDCALQTAVADDELYKAPVKGHFWHLRYPVIDPEPGEPTHVIVATTRPETMLGDTAVACHPSPRAALEAAIARGEDKLRQASQKERADVERELDALRERLTSHVPLLETIAAMARDGRKVMLPLQDRPIPLILDEWAKPELGSGCVKITPAHDPNDHDVWTRHKDAIGIVNVLAIDGSINEHGGAYRGLDRFEARDKVVADLDARGLLERVEDREIEIDHSDRSKTIVEPYVSKQWFVRMGDVPGGIVCGRGTPNEFRSPGLAQAAIDAADPDWRSPSGRQVRFWPDQDRYHKIYHQWLVEKRDWCISRQLWWGHRIPVWKGAFRRDQLLNLEGVLGQDHAGIAAWVVLQDGTQVRPRDAVELAKAGDPRTDTVQALLCVLDEDRERQIAPILQAGGLAAEQDVLDTWFSSALWPHSTLGWPDPATARVDAGQTPLGGSDGRPDSLSFYYPGSCLVTGRDIITLWVARMVLTGLYNLGDVPFTDVFLHATIMDGRGERMSKSKGNGVDPLDVIAEYGADAMRFVLCEMQTGTQDIRLPVQVISPFDGARIDLAACKPGPWKGTYVDPTSGQVFDMVGMMESQGVPSARATSDRFEVGRNFCNKLWNAARFAFLNLEGTTFTPIDAAALCVEDRWILSRLADAVARVDGGLRAYNPSVAVTAVRDFFWNELCDWYLELVKPRMKDARAADARQVLAHCLDQTLRLLHPFVPFVTEELWARLAELAPARGLATPLPSTDGLLVHATWPSADDDARDRDLEARVSFAQDVVTALREVRARYQVAPSARVPIVLKAAGDSAAALDGCEHVVAHMAGAATVTIDADYRKPKDAATAVVRDVEAFVLGVVDLDKERDKLQKQRDKLAGQVDGIERKLGNDGFVAKAPAEVVERERARLADLRRQLESLDAALGELWNARVLVALALAACAGAPDVPDDWVVTVGARAGAAGAPRFDDSDAILAGFDEPGDGDRFAAGDRALFGLEFTDGDATRRWTMLLEVEDPRATVDGQLLVHTSTFSLRRPDGTEVFRSHMSDVLRMRITRFDEDGTATGSSTIDVARDHLAFGLARGCEVFQGFVRGSRQADDAELDAAAATISACRALFELIQQDELLADVLWQIARAPSVWSVVTHGGVDVGLDLRMDEAIAVEVEPRLDDVTYRMPLRIDANDEPALLVLADVVEPRSPWNLGAGVVGLTAERPGSGGARLRVRLLAARRAAD